MQKTDSSLVYSPDNFPELVMKVNEGVDYVKDPNIQVTFTSSRNDIRFFSLVLGSSCAESEWEPAQEMIPLLLTGDDGEKPISMVIKTQYGFMSKCVTKTLVLDRQPPVVSSLNAPASGSYRASQVLNFEVIYSEATKVTGLPRIPIVIGGITRYAVYSSGSGTNKLNFQYTVSDSDNDTDGIVINLLELNSGTITDLAGNVATNTFTIPSTSGVLVDSTNPTITSVQGPALVNYATGQSLVFRINYGENVTVIGTPRLTLTIGSMTRHASFGSGSGTNQLTFSYTIVSEDSDDNGIAILASVDLNGGTIVDLAGNASALTFTVPNTSGVNVNSVVVSGMKISAGGNHNCGINTVGALKCWGSNASSQLGDGTTTNRSSPILIDQGTAYSQIAAGSYAIDTTGESSYSCGITSAGALKCWGTNFYRQLGDGTTADRSSPVLIDQGTSYSQIAGGWTHTCGITTGGVLKCWGSNTDGRLGDGTVTNRSTPVIIDPGTSYSQISLGLTYSCGITTSGVLKCWGFNFYGQLGDGTTTSRSSPVTIDEGTSYSQITAGGDHTCGITTSGVLKCWGRNTSSQLGDGTIDNRSLPVIIDPGTSYSQVTGGALHTCAITTSGALKCWGNNGAGRLGDGTTTSRSLPVIIDPGTSYYQISGGDFQTCGITTGGVLKCWGGNGSGQLGDGTTTNRLTPTIISGF